MLKHLALVLISMSALFAQGQDAHGSLDHVSAVVIHQGDTATPLVYACPPDLVSPCERSLYEHAALPHPFRLEARHPKDGCDDTAVCGALFYEDDGVNLRTSAGTNWQSQIMNDTSTPAVNTQCNYLGLTDTAITLAEADMSLSGEITSNGLSRAQATYTNASTTLSVPSAPTSVTPEGTAGSTTYYYWVAAGNQGIFTTPSASTSTATSNATLSTTNYNQVVFTGQLGAAAYQMYRTTSNTAPSGTVSDLVGGAPYCTTSGTVVTCTWNDVSNTLSSVTIPGSNLTNFGKNTLVYTWTATASQAAQAFGVFTAAGPPVAGTMCFEGTFSQVSLNTNDTLQLQESVYF